LTVLSLIGSVPGVFGQATDGNIVGTVTDASQAVVPNATVTATNLATAVAHTAMTNSVGQYRINNLPIGSYDVAVMANGMAPQKLSSVLVELNRTTTVNATLQVGGISADIVVQEAPPLLDQSTSQLESIFKSDAALNVVGAGNYLKDNGVLNLSLLAPNVT